MRFVVTYGVNRGYYKDICDDSALIGRTVINDTGGETVIETPAWVCLCDGVGGNAGGKEASLFVCGALSEQPVPQDADGVRSAFLQVNRMLLEHAAKISGCRNMATTATALLFLEDAVYLAHVGNTRLYALRGGFLQQITKDHTTCQWLKDTGNAEAAESCNKSEIRGAMGGGSERYIGTLEVKRVFEKKLPSVLLLTTDGIHDTLTEDEMEQTVSSSEDQRQCVHRLCSDALEKGTDDDRSAIMIQVL